MPAIILRFHRYVGLALAAILIVMGASGALLAFYEEIDGFFNDDMRMAPPAPGAEPLPPLVLRKRLEVQIPGASAHKVPLSLHAGRAAVLPVTSRDGTPLTNDEYFVDPYTGEILGQRRRGDLSQGLANLMPFILEFHKTLTLGKTGTTILGLAADLRLLVRTLPDVSAATSATPPNEWAVGDPLVGSLARARRRFPRCICVCHLSITHLSDGRLAA